MTALPGTHWRWLDAGYFAELARLGGHVQVGNLELALRGAWRRSNARRAKGAATWAR